MDLTFIKAWLSATFAKDEEGAGLVEYVLLVGLIAVVAIAAVAFLGSRVTSNFSGVANSMP